MGPAYAPFTIALTIMGAIAVLELLGLLFGVAFSGLLDNLLPDFAFEADGLGGDGLEGDAPDTDGSLSASPLSQFLSWLCVGKVPVLILLAALLGSFGLVGLGLQNGLSAVFGFRLPAVAASVVALVAALPMTRMIGLAVARILPREETDAVSTATFIGLVAVVIRGEARKGAPAEAKLRDLAGGTQYVLVEPDAEDAVFRQGAEVLITEKNGAVYRAIENSSPVLAHG